MKTLKNGNSFMDEIKAAQAEGAANIDLDGIDLPAQLYREMEALREEGDNEAAKELYVDSLMLAVVAVEEKEFISEYEIAEKSKVSQNGGKKRGMQKTDDANSTKQWLYPLLASCDASIPPESRQRGSKTLERLAKREILRCEVLKRQSDSGLIDPRKSFVTKARIDNWIRVGRPKDWQT